jgi:4a-hydroxytetrahydrobiopterin dehydratase
MWQKSPDGLYKCFKFKNFAEAFAFMTRVADEAEREGHHPKWLNEWNIVEIWLSTHEKGMQITEKDELLAGIIDSLEK